MRSFSLVIASLVIFKFCHAAPWDSHSSNGGYRGPILIPNAPNNKQRYLDYMELKDNGPNSYEGEEGYRTLLKPPKDRGFAPNEGNTYSSRAKSDRQNTMPRKNGSQVIEQPKPDKSIGNTNATKSNSIPSDTKGMKQDGFRALRQPQMEKGSAPTKGNTNSSQAKSDRQHTLPKKKGSQAIEHPKPDKSIGNTNVTKSDTIPGDTEGMREDGSGALMQPQMEEGSALNKGNITSAGVNSDKPDPKHTDSGDITSGNGTNNSTHGDAESSSGSEETKEAEPSSLTNSKKELNLTQNETPPKNETEDSQQGNISTKPIEQQIVKLNETQSKTVSVNKTGKTAGEDDKVVKGDTIKTDQDGEEASGSGFETDLSQTKSNATQSHDQCSSACNKCKNCDCDAELPDNRRALLERALVLLERAHKLPRTIASQNNHSANSASANMTNKKLRVKRSAGSLLDREKELIGEIRKELSEDREQSEKSSGQDTVKEVNSGPEWKDDDEKEFVSGIDPNGKRRKRETTDESYKERLEKIKLLQASFPTASAVQELPTLKSKSQVNAEEKKETLGNTEKLPIGFPDSDAVKDMTFQQIKAKHTNIPMFDAMKETKVDGGKKMNLANANEKVLQSGTPKAYAVVEKPGLIECKTIDCKTDGFPSADAVKEEGKGSKKPNPKDLLRSYRPLDIGAVESESKSDNKQTKVKPLEADQHPLADAVKDSAKSKGGVMEMSEFPSAYAVREGPQLKIPAARLVKAAYSAEDDVKDSAKADAKIDAKAHIANLPVASAVKEASDLGRTNVRNEAETKTNAASSTKVLDAKTPIANEPVASAVKEASVLSKTMAETEAKSRSHVPLDAEKQIGNMPAASAVKEASGMSQTNAENIVDSKNTVASSKKGLNTKAQIANLPIASAVKEAFDLGQTNSGAKAALTNKWHQIDVSKLITNMPVTGAVKEASDLSQNNTESDVSGLEEQEHDSSLDTQDGSGDEQQDENSEKVKNVGAVVGTSESSGSQPPSSMGNATTGNLKDESANGGSILEKSEPHMNNASLANDSAKSDSEVAGEIANTTSPTNGSDTKDSKQMDEENTLKDIIEGEANGNATLSTTVDSEPAGDKTEGIQNADEKEGVNSTSPALHPVSSDSGEKESGSANKTSVADETETSDNNGTNSTTGSEPSDLNSSQATLEGKDSTSNGTSKESQSLRKTKLNNTENDNNTKLNKASEQSDSGNEEISGDKTVGSGEKEQDEENFGAVNLTESTNRTLLSANGTSERIKTKLSEDKESPMNVSTEAVSEKSIGMVEEEGIANNPSDADDAQTGNKIEAEGEVHDTADAEEPTAEAVKEKPVEIKHDKKPNHTESANAASIMANGTSNKKPETKPSSQKESPMNASTEAESEKSKNTTNDEGIDNRTLDAGGTEMGNKTEDQDIVEDSAEDPAPEAVKEKPEEMKQVGKMTPANEEKEDFPAADAVKEKPTSSTADKSLKGKLFPVRERAVALEQKKKKERSSRAD